jgi:hypothetical protein
MKLIILISTLILSSCASLKYPGWDQVKTEISVFNKPCRFQGEEVNSCKEVDWFKKRATIFKANTIVLVPSNTKTDYCLSGYFYCGANIPPLTFNKNDYISYLKQGSNKVTGQAFLRQKGGGIVTCAGEEVTLYPNTDYFNNMYGIRGDYIEHKQLENENSLVRQTKCDAQGNFEFYNIPAGNWALKTDVEWSVFWAEGVYSPPINIGRVHMPSSYSSHLRDSKQGGILTLDIIVKDNEPNKFIISE